jgi:hypothetical protein
MTSVRRPLLGERPVARRKAYSMAVSAVSGPSRVTGHFGKHGPPTWIGLSRAKWRSAGWVDARSPRRAAQPRFHQISCQSAAKTATAISPSRFSTRWTPDGMSSEIYPSAKRDKSGQPIQMISFLVREL